MPDNNQPQPVDAPNPSWEPITSDTPAEEGENLAVGAEITDAPEEEVEETSEEETSETLKPSEDEEQPLLTITEDDGTQVNLTAKEILSMREMFRQQENWSAKNAQEARQLAAQRGQLQEMERLAQYKPILNHVASDAELQQIIFMKQANPSKSYGDIIKQLGLDASDTEPEMYDADGRVTQQWFAWHDRDIVRKERAKFIESQPKPQRDPTEGMTEEQKDAYRMQNDPVYRGTARASAEFASRLQSVYGIDTSAPGVVEEVSSRVGAYLAATGFDVNKDTPTPRQLEEAFITLYPKEYERVVKMRDTQKRNANKTLPRLNEKRPSNPRSLPSQGVKRPDEAFFA